MPILLNDLSLVWPDGTTCFSGLNGVFSGPLTALIGDNGAGKTTLLGDLSLIHISRAHETHE